MPSLEMSIPHQLGQEEALKRIQSLLPGMKTAYADKIRDIQEEWNGNRGVFSFNVMGFNVSGVLTVTDSSVELDGNLPFAASLFKGKIKSVIEEQGGKLLC